MSILCKKAVGTSPPTTELQVDLVLQAVPYPGSDAKPGEKLIDWRIWVGNPLDFQAEFWPLVSLDGVWQDPVGPSGIPAHFTFQEFAVGGFRNVYAGETHTVCVKPKYPDKPGANWPQVCRTITA